MKKKEPILYVEDDADTCELIKFLLEGENFQVTSTPSGKEALKLVRQNKFSALVLDNWIKDMNGIELCREIRTFDQKTPIIFYSGAALPKDMEAGFECGAQAYLIKPDGFDDIIKTVKELTSSNLE